MTVSNVGNDLVQLRNEYKNFLMQRMSAPSPHLTFKKFLAGKRSFDLLEYYDSIKDLSDEYCFSGEISFGGNFAREGCNTWTNYEKECRAFYVTERIKEGRVE